MSALVVAFPGFLDLKKRIAHSGGFSDGGVICVSKELSASGVDLAPAAGTALGGFSTPTGDAALADTNASALFMNFDPDVPVDVEVSLVHEDGSTKKFAIYHVPQNTPDGAGVAPAPLGGFILTYPNKLRYKLVAQSGYSLPTGRVLLKAGLVEYDKPRDLDA